MKENNKAIFYQFDEQKIKIITTCSANDEFYKYMGQFFASKQIAKELGAPLYNEDNYIWWLALNELDEVVGFCALELGGKSIILKHGYITELYRGIGLYKQIVNMACQYAKQQNKTIRIVVIQSLTKYWTTQNFQKTGTRGKYNLMKWEPSK